MVEVIPRTSLGKDGPQVSRIALGCMGMSGVYGATDEKESIATIHAAIDAGVNLFDTGDFYGMGDNEMLLGRALEGRRNQVLLSVKFGAMRSPDNQWIGTDGRPRAVKNFLAYSLKRLRTGHIDIYRLSRTDPEVPIEETIGAIADMVRAGYVRYIGLSESGVETIRRAAATHPVCDLQIEYAIATRGIERSILPAVRERGIAVTAYGVLSRGMLTGSRPQGPRDARSYFPRFREENQGRNQQAIAQLVAMAAAKGATPAQLAIAWVLSRGGDIVPVMGSRTRAQLSEALAALQVELSAEDLGRLEEIGAAVAGTRYDESQMKWLDSEK